VFAWISSWFILLLPLFPIDSCSIIAGLAALVRVDPWQTCSVSSAPDWFHLPLHDHLAREELPSSASAPADEGPLPLILLSPGLAPRFHVSSCFRLAAHHGYISYVWTFSWRGFCILVCAQLTGLALIIQNPACIRHQWRLEVQLVYVACIRLQWRLEVQLVYVSRKIATSACKSKSKPLIHEIGSPACIRCLYTPPMEIGSPASIGLT
jgi:hypothetical protein